MHESNRIYLHALWGDIINPHYTLTITICQVFHSIQLHRCHSPTPTQHVPFVVVRWRFRSITSARKFQSGQTALFWTTFCRAGFSERWQWIMRYSSSRVDERLITMMQWTRTFPAERTRDVKEGLAKGFSLINITHGCLSHTASLFFSSGPAANYK